MFQLSLLIKNQIRNYSSILTDLADRISESLGLKGQGLEFTLRGLARRVLVEFPVHSAPILTKLFLGYLPLIAKPFAFSTRVGVDAAIHTLGMLSAESKAEFLKHGYRALYSSIKWANNLWMMELVLTLAAPALSREISDTIYGTLDHLIDDKMGDEKSSNQLLRVDIPLSDEQKELIEMGLEFDIIRNADNQLEVRVKEDRREEVPLVRVSTRARTTTRAKSASSPTRSSTRLGGVQKKSSAKKTNANKVDKPKASINSTNTRTRSLRRGK